MNNKIVMLKTKIVDHLHYFFQSVISKPSNEYADNCLLCSFSCPMGDLFVIQAGVFNQLVLLDSKKACGPKEISNKSLKQCAEWLPFYFNIIFKK